jgi:large subunit ribosomal protein L33
MVMMESMVSGHKYNTIRERLADKLEEIRFDPLSKYKTQHDLNFI